MSRRMKGDGQLGQDLKLRDLHVLSTVVRLGSMAKAAAHLGVSQPAISEIIANLESVLKVRLLDRSRQGIESTIYGRTLLKRSLAAFDELKQGLAEIESLADPTSGELRIGCPESAAAAVVAPVVQRFMGQYPRVSLQMRQLIMPAFELAELPERKLDIVVTRLATRPGKNEADFDFHYLFDDRAVLIAGAKSRWARCRHIDLADLIDEPWSLPPSYSWSYLTVADAFAARGLPMPRICTTTFLVHLRADLAATGPYISALPLSMVQTGARRLGVKLLPIDMPLRPWPLAAVTLKNGALNPVTALFLDHLRAFAKELAAERTAEMALA